MWPFNQSDDLNLWMGCVILNDATYVMNVFECVLKNWMLVKASVEKN